MLIGAAPLLALQLVDVQIYKENPLNDQARRASQCHSWLRARDGSRPELDIWHSG